MKSRDPFQFAHLDDARLRQLRVQTLEAIEDMRNHLAEIDQEISYRNPRKTKSYVAVTHSPPAED